MKDKVKEHGDEVMKKTDNELIAELGYKRQTQISRRIQMEIQIIKLSKVESELLSDFIGEDIGDVLDFNRLMPVVEKIESLGYNVAIESSFVEIGDDFVPVSTFAEEGDTKILITYLAVVEFIHWYNEQSK